MEIKRFGDLQEGDVILGPDGEHLTVSRAYEEHIPESMFELTAENGEVIEASGSHLWYVESEFDVSFHRERLKTAKKVLRKLPSEMIELLEEYSQDRDDELAMSMGVLLEKLALEDSHEGFNVVMRVAESLGPIEELSYTGVDLGDSTQIEGNDVPIYDGRLMAQQLLSLTGPRKYRKKWPVIVGRVIRTEEIAELGCEVSIPHLRQS